MRMRYKLNNPPPNVSLFGNFTKSCLLDLTADAQLSLTNGSLKINLYKRGSKSSSISDLKVSIASTKGNIAIIVGSDGSEVSFKEASSGGFQLHLWRKSRVVIGEGTTTSTQTKIVCDKTEFVTGKDCMLSDGLLIQGADQHGIVDLKTGEIINNRKRRIMIGDHVWIGRGSTVMPDVTIGEGSIIATNATVTKDVPAFSLVAGIPANVMKSDVSWSRTCSSKDVYSEQYVKQYAVLNKKNSA